MTATAINAIAAGSAALDAACAKLYKEAISAAKSEAKVITLLRETLTSFVFGSTAFNAAKGQLQQAYIEARLNARQGFDLARAKEEIAKRGFNASKCDAEGNPQKGMRTKDVHATIRTAESNFSHLLRELGYISEDKRAANAKRKSQDDAAPSQDDAAPSQDDAPQFEKSFSGFAMMEALASQVDKALRARSANFKDGSHAVASDFVAAVRAMVEAKAKEDAAKE